MKLGPLRQWLAQRVIAAGNRLSLKVAGAIIGVAFVVLLVSGGAGVWVFLRAHQDMTTELYNQRADAAARQIAGFIEGIDARLRGLVQPSWHSLSPDDREIEAMRLLRAMPAVSELRIIDPTGRERLRVGQLTFDVVGAGTDLADDPGYRAASRVPTSLGAVTFQGGSEPYVTLYVRADGPEAGMVIAEVNLKLIWDMVVPIRIGAQGYAYVVDGHGQLIAHPDISLVLRRTALDQLPQVRAALDRAVDGPRLFPGRNLAGQAILSAHERVPLTDWRVITEVPREEAYAVVVSTVWLSVLALFGSLAAAVVLGVTIARGMTRPIRQLAAGAARIGAGDLDHRIAIDGHDELAELGRRFNRMAEQLGTSYATLEDKVAERTEELAQANRAKSRFLATASHDLRQPLHALGLFIDELNASPTPERRAQLLSHLTTAIGSLNTMFEAILDTSRIEAHAVTPVLVAFPLDRILGPLAAMFTPTADAKGMRLSVEPCARWVRSDPVLLQRVLQNLMSNAIRYTNQGTVSVTCRMAGTLVEITVRDTGPGIPADIQRDMFAEFHRGTQTGERGLGLGLFIVERFAQLLGLDLRVVSEPGAGSAFTVAVPVTEPEQPDPPLVMQPGRGRTALVVDDDPQALHGMAEFLRSLAFQVTEARDATAALASGAGSPDILVTDQDLGPGPTGVELLAALQARKPTMKAIVVTGQPDALPSDIARAGGVQVLGKPVLPLALRGSVARLLA